ncbi:ribosomal protein subunit L20 [Schizosaccharomyces cryophilus OY26]|uniref:Ribosomal protein subunit L20 n=1 Tax=Schizosaccharomyces cryophilus (strain OY26 / ATCC MYA-4695 / CBS 11777 / NBRC 106824 / NRRL Y48691) TaxID=653667 RepID=S9VUJ4_SCHCR|nr:ribosomal protein subunit L20 [Schizosaccharomyces cryophilus OY26]EPY49819.1 ribosomal protein subunit L20 [Schizosaccharomyces cryophilus OY26]
MFHFIKQSWMRQGILMQIRNINRLYPKMRIPKRPEVPLGTKIAEMDASADVYYNPPASSPDTRITPLLFRYDAPSTEERETLAEKIKDSLSPVVSRKAKSKGNLRFSVNHLSDEEKNAIHDLRLSDPNEWTTGALSKKFRATRLLISRICEAPKERLAAVEEELDQQKLHWGKAKRQVRREKLSRNNFRVSERVSKI